MDKYSDAILKIVNEQKLIIGPIAFDLAKRVQGVTVISEKEITIIGDPKSTLESVVVEYEKLFGRSSVEVSKEVIKKGNGVLQPEELPAILR